MALVDGRSGAQIAEHRVAMRHGKKNVSNLGRDGVSPDLPLPCWEATDKQGGARVRKGVGGRAVEGLRHGCGGERDLRTAGWPQRK